MRDFDERMAEISRRSAVRIKQIRKRRIGILTACVPVVLCMALALGMDVQTRNEACYTPGEALKIESDESLSMNGKIPLKDSADAPEANGTGLLEGVLYFPVQGNTDNAGNPQVTVIASKEALDSYYSSNPDSSGLNQGEYYNGSGKDTMAYDAGFFEGSYLVLVRLEQESSAVRYQVAGVEETDGGMLTVKLQRLVSESAADSTVQWDIILELKKNGKVVGEEQVLVEFQ